jgi:hypothetical protein
MRNSVLRPLSILPLLAVLSSGCGEKKSSPDEIVPRDLAADPVTPPPSEDPAPDDAPIAAEPVGEPVTESDNGQAEADPAPPHPGPWFWVLRSSAAVYKNAKADRNEKVGYIKKGGQIGIIAGKVDGPDCSAGWFKVKTGGFICSLVGTTDENHKDVKFRPTQPNLEEILPYKYARNSKNGTPLYRSIPSIKQAHYYEPYLPGAIAEKERLEKERQEDERQMREAGLMVGDDPETIPPAKVEEDGSLPTQDSDKRAKSAADGSGESTATVKKTPPKKEEAGEVPLWEREDDLHKVTLDDLRKEKDDILETRMMKGFYVAIDKTFQWDGRTWYKTTKGLVTPSANFWQTEGSDFKGVEIDGENIQLPLGWVYGGRDSTTTYEIDTATNTIKPKGSKKKFELVELQYNFHRIGNTDYFQMKDGDWIRAYHVRITTPGERPKEVGPRERWLDVDISEQTVVVFEGDRPVYATLLSSGKESKVKEKDHSTPRGMWRVREKHVVSTMDGDGTAAGDLPYSIEDVPYIMYFHKSYATHGAFWHRNYGVQMSHGCVNLAPLDAKWIFFYADPQLPQGFHGNWSTEENPGSMVVVHD